MVTLLNRLGFRTLWSCAGFGASRIGVTPPLSRLPQKDRRHVKSDGYDYYMEDREHLSTNYPYLMFNAPEPSPDWLAGVLGHLRHAKVGGNDLYTDRFSDYADAHLVKVGSLNGATTLDLANDAEAIVETLEGIPLCKVDVITVKRMWLHEVVKAFSFM